MPTAFRAERSPRLAWAIGASATIAEINHATVARWDPSCLLQRVNTFVSTGRELTRCRWLDNMISYVLETQSLEHCLDMDVHIETPARDCKIDTSLADLHVYLNIHGRMPVTASSLATWLVCAKLMFAYPCQRLRTTCITTTTMYKCTYSNALSYCYIYSIALVARAHLCSRSTDLIEPFVYPSYLPTCLPYVYCLLYLPTYRPTYLPTRAHPYTYTYTCAHTHTHTHPHAHTHTHTHACVTVTPNINRNTPW